MEPDIVLQAGYAIGVGLFFAGCAMPVTGAAAIFLLQMAI